jgi:hypothetical protein
MFFMTYPIRNILSAVVFQKVSLMKKLMIVSLSMYSFVVFDFALCSNNKKINASTQTIEGEFSGVRMVDVGSQVAIEPVLALIDLELDDNNNVVGIADIQKVSAEDLFACIEGDSRPKTAKQAFYTMIKGVSNAAYGAGTLLYIGGKIVIPHAISMTKEIWAIIVRDYFEPAKHKIIQLGMPERNIPASLGH